MAKHHYPGLPWGQRLAVHFVARAMEADEVVEEVVPADVDAAEHARERAAVERPKLVRVVGEHFFALLDSAGIEVADAQAVYPELSVPLKQTS